MGAPWTRPQEIPSRKQKLISFEGGHNVGTASVNIQDNQSSSEYGWEIDDLYPALHTKLGINTEGISGGAVPTLLTSFKNEKLIRGVGTVIQQYLASVWTDIGTGLTNADFSSVNFEVAGNPAIIFTNGTDAVKYWDGTTFASLNASAPTGKYITSDSIRVWIAKGDILYFCAFLDAQDWTTAKDSGSVQFFTPKGGDITGLIRYADRTVVFKKDAMAEMHGTNYFEFRLMDISMDIGCENSKTLVEVQGLLMWLGSGQEVYTHTGARPKPVGAAIKSYLNDINTTYIDKCFAFTDGIKYFLGLVTGTATEPNILLCYHPIKGLWRVVSKDDNFRFGYLYNGVTYVLDSSGVVSSRSGYTDNGNAIVSEYVTKPDDYGVPNAEKEFFELYIQGYIPTGSTVEVYISRHERGTVYESIDTISGDSTDSVSSNLLVPLDTVPLCKWSRFKLVCTGEVTLYQMEVYYDEHPVQL